MLMSDRLITKECIAFYILTFAVQVCVRKKDVSFVVDVAICVCKKKEVSFVVDAAICLYSSEVRNLYSSKVQ